MTPMNKATALYLRVDGSLMLVCDGQALEMQLTPRQLLDLGTDALRLSLALDPGLVGAITDVLETTHIVPLEILPCHMN